MDENNFNKEGKIPALESTFKDPIEKKVAYMIATSHEYKTPNVNAALKFVRNYRWELSSSKLCDLQGINKPVDEDKVNHMIKTMRTVKPFIVVNQFHGIRPQTPGKKILIDGHHRHKACEGKGMSEVPVYKGTYTGKAEKSIEELKEMNKVASEEQFYYHASPVQGIKRFRRSEDTSGNNKGKVIFASKEPSFSAAFGTRWHDGIARLNVNTSNASVPDEDNYNGTVLKYTNKVNIDAPCSMYKIKGKFEPLRYGKDLESVTNKDVKIISEEQFKSFKDMAKAYGLELHPVSEEYVLNKLKSKKSSNFEKVAMCKEEIYKEAGFFKKKKKKKKIGGALGAYATGAAIANKVRPTMAFSMLANQYDKHMAGQQPLNKEQAQQIVDEMSKKHKMGVIFREAEHPLNSNAITHKGAKIVHKLTKAVNMEHVLDRAGLPDLDTLKDAIKNKKGIVHSGKNEAIILHELGHIKSGNRRFVPAAYNQTLMAGAGPIALFSDKSKNKIRQIGKGKSNIGDKTVNFAEKYPEAVFLGASLPRLSEEARASLFATRELVGKYGMKKGLGKAKILLPAYGTYAAAAATKSLVGGSAYRIVRKRKEDK